MGPYWYGWDMGWGGWVFMGIAMFIVVVLAVAGIIALIRYSGRAPYREQQQPPPQQPSSQDEANRILDARFARGEIDANEYAERRRVLSSHGGHRAA